MLFCVRHLSAYEYVKFYWSYGSLHIVIRSYLNELFWSEFTARMLISKFCIDICVHPQSEYAWNRNCVIAVFCLEVAFGDSEYRSTGRSLRGSTVCFWY